MTAPQTTAPEPPAPLWRRIARDHLHAPRPRLAAAAGALARAADEALDQGAAAFASMTRLTRDNLALAGRVAREWRALPADAWRRALDWIAPPGR